MFYFHLFNHQEFEMSPNARRRGQESETTRIRLKLTLRFVLNQLYGLPLVGMVKARTYSRSASSETIGINQTIITTQLHALRL